MHGSSEVEAGQHRIAVVGAGRAGAARVRAIESHALARLAAVVRRPPSEPAFVAGLADPRVSALIVCTPNALHAAQVGAGLRAGKHVAVEFPLADSEREAGGLFELARACGRVLHVEHIELLSPSQARLREAARGLGPPAGGRVTFRGDSGGWIGDASQAGGPGLRALARLHRLVDLFGAARVAGVRYAGSAGGGYRLEVALRFARGGLELVEERAPGLARGLEWDVWCEGGWLAPPPPEPPTGLFARDLELFLARIETGAPPSPSEARELHVHALVDAIDRSWVCSPT
jgi:predicted dehydrogenase